MKKIIIISYLFTFLTINIMASNVVGSVVHPNKKKFSKTPIAGALHRMESPLLLLTKLRHHRRSWIV